MTELIERKIRLHAQRLYEQRGQAEGSALQDWVDAEAQVLENSILAPLYRKSRIGARGDLSGSDNPQLVSAESSDCGADS
jgi:hypothetical protein